MFRKILEIRGSNEDEGEGLESFDMWDRWGEGILEAWFAFESVEDNI